MLFDIRPQSPYVAGDSDAGERSRIIEQSAGRLDADFCGRPWKAAALAGLQHSPTVVSGHVVVADAALIV
jgi:hypothetical protein